MIKRLLLFFGSVTVIIALNFGDFFSPETKELQAIATSDEHAQIMMSKELYQFYSTSDKSFEFYEIYWKNRYLINYNPKKQILHISMDIFSGWLPTYYVAVTESMLEKLSNSGFLLEEYDQILEKSSPGRSESVKTNGCMGVYGK